MIFAVITDPGTARAVGEVAEGMVRLHPVFGFGEVLILDAPGGRSLTPDVYGTYRKPAKWDGAGVTWAEHPTIEEALQHSRDLVAL